MDIATFPRGGVWAYMFPPGLGSGGGGGGGGAIEVEDEGVSIVAAATILNFTGGVTVTDNGGGEAKVAIAGAGVAGEQFNWGKYIAGVFRWPRG